MHFKQQITYFTFNIIQIDELIWWKSVQESVYFGHFPGLFWYFRSVFDEF